MAVTWEAPQYTVTITRPDGTAETRPAESQYLARRSVITDSRYHAGSKWDGLSTVMPDGTRFDITPGGDLVVPKAEIKLPSSREVRETQETHVATAEIVPMDLNPEPVPLDGADILFRLQALLEYYARWPDRETALLTALWIAGTWWRAPDGLPAFRVFPLWLAIAPPGSGKTRLLELIAALCWNPSGIELFPTEPSVREMLSDLDTLILDELQRLTGNGNGMRRIQSYLTGGYKLSGETSHAKGGGPNKVTVFGPKALGARPELLSHTGTYLEDLAERCLPIVQPFKSSDIIPDQDDDWDYQTARMRLLLASWGAEQTRDLEPTLIRQHPVLWPVHTVPTELTGRDRELAQFYFTIADRARSPELVAAEGKDIRWALMARDAVRKLSLGQNLSGKEIVDQLRAKMTELGIAVPS